MLRNTGGHPQLSVMSAVCQRGENQNKQGGEELWSLTVQKSQQKIIILHQTQVLRNPNLLVIYRHIFNLFLSQLSFKVSKMF